MRSEETRNNVPKVLRLTQNNMIGKYHLGLDQERCLSQSILIRYFIYLPPAFPSGRSGESQLRRGFSVGVNIDFLMKLSLAIPEPGSGEGFLISNGTRFTT